MSDTPRTDATSGEHSTFHGVPFVPADFARELERELAIAMKALRYCAIEPGWLHSTQNAQHAVAMNALGEIAAMASDPPSQ